jgi:hypothetical protein
MSMEKLRRIAAELPSPLLRLMEEHLLCMVGSLSAIIVLLFLSADARLLLPPAAILLFAALSAFSLYRAYTSGDILFLTGTCTALEQTPIRRKTKVIYAVFEDRQVRIRLNRSISEASVGDSVMLMLSGKAPIYEQDGLCTVFRYYTVSVRPKHGRVDYASPPFEISAYPGRGTDDCEDFEDWSMNELRDRVRLVQEFDRLADRMVSEALELARTCTVEEEESLVPKTRKVLVPSA